MCPKPDIYIRLQEGQETPVLGRCCQHDYTSRQDVEQRPETRPSLETQAGWLGLSCSGLVANQPC